MGVLGDGVGDEVSSRRPSVCCNAVRVGAVGCPSVPPTTFCATLKHPYILRDRPYGAKDIEKFVLVLRSSICMSLFHFKGS